MTTTQNHTIALPATTVICILLCLHLAHAVLLTTSWGPGLTTDSVTYIEAARSIIKNGSLVELSPHYPPFYPVLLAATSVLPGEDLSNIRLFNITLAFLHGLLFAAIAYRASGGNKLVTLLGVLIFCTSPTVLQIHTLAWSEGAFSLLATLGLYCLALLCFNWQTSRIALVIVCLSLALLTRYAGITLVLVAGFAPLVWQSGSMYTRLWRASVLCTLISLPLGFWLIRNIFLGLSATNRSLFYHPVSFEKIRAGALTILHWFGLPSNYPLLIFPLLLALGAAYSIVYRRSDGEQIWLLRIFGLFVVTYIAFILFSISFIDSHTPLDFRILFPIYVPLLLLVLIGTSHLLSVTRHSVSILLPVCIVFCLVVWKQGRIHNDLVAELQHNGAGLSHRAWAESETLRAVSHLPENISIYSNGPDLIQLYLGRSSSMVPKITDPNTNRNNDDFQMEIGEMREDLQSRQAILVFFTRIGWRWYLPSPPQLQKLLPSISMQQYKDGIIWSSSQ